MPSPWIQHLRDHAATHGLTYAQALKDPRAKASYTRTSRACSTKVKGGCACVGGEGPGMSKVAPSRESQDAEVVNAAAKVKPVEKHWTEYLPPLPPPTMKERALLDETQTAKKFKKKRTLEAQEAAQNTARVAAYVPTYAEDEIAAAEPVGGNGLRAIARKMHGKGMPIPAPRGFKWVRVLAQDIPV